jgi:hypothetical protein
MVSCSLSDIESYVLSQCPTALEIINEDSQYAFSRRTVRAGKRTFTADVLHVAYMHKQDSPDRAYAVRDPLNQEIVMYHGKPTETLAPAGDLYPDPDPERAKKPITNIVYPFCLAEAHRL